MALKLFAASECYQALKIKVAAQYTGVELEVADVKSSADFKNVSPRGKSPVLVTSSGPIFEANAILRYIARSRPDALLFGDSFHEAGLVDQWVDFSSTELEPVRNVWVLPVKGVLEFNGKAYSEARSEMQQILAYLNTHLGKNTYLVSQKHVTLADIAIASALAEPYRDLFEPKFRNAYANVNKWFSAVVEQKQFQAVVGKMELAKQEKRAVRGKPEGDNKGDKQQQQKGGDKQKENDQKQQQQQQQQKPQKQQKQQKQEQKPKEEPADDLGDEEAAPKKAKSALDGLPPSKMNLDACKRNLFSQRPWNADFFKFFWPQFDPQGYSIYFASYNYNTENKVYFMTCNLLGGFIQRSDEARKYALGSMVLSGKSEEEPPYDVTAMWIFRGQDVPEELKENPDTEYYTFTKLDSSNPEHRQKVETWFFADNVPDSTGAQKAVLDRRFLK